MIYFKIINNQAIIGAVSQLELRCYKIRHNSVMACTPNLAQYVEYNNILYHDDWMKLPTDGIDFVQATVERIEEEEYNALVPALETEEFIEINEPKEITIEEPEEETDETLAYIKDMKIRQLSMDCENAIVSGVDVTLSDGESHHFSASLEDQINLLSLSLAVANGEKQILYHADGELCKYYTSEDMAKIIEAMTAAKTYHTTYYNSLKSYVQSLDNIHDIASINYGTEIPTEFQSDILKDMIEK